MMSVIKRWLKTFFYRTGNAKLLDKLNFRMASWQYKEKNNKYRQANPETILPPPYFLYETYSLDYEKYIEDGMVAAKEIITWTKPYCKNDMSTIFEWGCGVSRIIRHLPGIVPRSVSIFGADINSEMIDWNNKNIAGINFKTIDLHPPTVFAENKFDLAYAISVFTHVEGKEQLSWIHELHRIMSDHAIFLFTTHGENYVDQLSHSEKNHLSGLGYFTRNYEAKGHRMMTTYNDAALFKLQLAPYFDVLEFHDGKSDLNKTGGQDLWIVRKKS